MSELLPVRMLNEVTYCPRLYALEHLHGEWADNIETVQGRIAHRVVDKPSKKGLPLPGEPDETGPVVRRSVKLSDPELGIVGVIDLVEARDGEAVPTETKRGWPAPTPEGIWEPEQVQLAAQVLLLRAHGYRSQRAVVWFAGARRRVELLVDDALVARTLAIRDQARALLEQRETPPPLIDSPKCPRCSLVGICLPDEQNLLLGRTDRVRPIAPARDDKVPLYVEGFGVKLSLKGGELLVSRKGEPAGKASLEQVSHVVVRGAASVTSPTLRVLAKRDVRVSFQTHAGWLFGVFGAPAGRNVALRLAQARMHLHPESTAALARQFILGKIHNQRVLLRRNGKGPEWDRPLALLAHHATEASGSETVDVARGHEGAAAAVYFANLSRLFREPWASRLQQEGRKRRPAPDPINAVLSFLYGCLVRECTNTLLGVGLDPHVGFLHRLRPGRPSLSLDLMEEFRPILADSVTLRLFNTDRLQAQHFLDHPTGCTLTDEGRKRVIRAWEQRLSDLVTHPLFETRLTYRRLIEVQARLLAKSLTGDLPEYPPFRVR